MLQLAAIGIGAGCAADLRYIEGVEAERPDDYVTVILPEFVPKQWWQHLLHNQRALLIKGALLFRPNTVVTSVPFHLAR